MISLDPIITQSQGLGRITLQSTNGISKRHEKSHEQDFSTLPSPLSNSLDGCLP